MFVSFVPLIIHSKPFPNGIKYNFENKSPFILYRYKLSRWPSV